MSDTSTPTISNSPSIRGHDLHASLSFSSNAQEEYIRDTKFEEFLDVLTKLQINIPLLDTILQISSYTKFLKEMLSKKIKLLEFEIVALADKSGTRVPKKLLAYPVERSKEYHFQLEILVRLMHCLTQVLV